MLKRPRRANEDKFSDHQHAFSPAPRGELAIFFMPFGPLENLPEFLKVTKKQLWKDFLSVD